MKIPEKRKEKKGKASLKQIPKAKKEHVLIVAQEIKFARLLSGNEKKTRDRVLKSLKKWLLNCFEKNYEFKEDDFVRVWKGLFYAVWMSDKPLIQEELCESIAGILDVFPPDQLQHAMLMTKAGFRVLATEWYGIDQHRMDKFLMLVRRYLRGSFRVLLRCEWTLESCQMFSQMLTLNDGLFALKTPHYARNALSMQLHILDCYLEELSKVSQGAVGGAALAALVQPCCELLCGAEPALSGAARRLLTALLRHSAPAQRHQHAVDAWKQMGCPVGGPEALELVSDDDDDDDAQDNSDNDVDNEDDRCAGALDPRAGRVDVRLACLPVQLAAAQLAAALRRLLPSAASKAHRRLKICLERFERVARDEPPLPLDTAQLDAARAGAGPARPRRRAARALHKLEKTLVANSDELALRGLSRKHRKRLLAKSRAGGNIVEELQQLHQPQAGSTDSTNGDWQVEETEPKPKKMTQDSSNKENRNKKKRKHDKTDADAAKKRKMNGGSADKRHKNAGNDKKVAGNDKNVAENVKKVGENVKKVAENRLKNAEKSPKPHEKKKKNKKIVENGVKKTSEAVTSETSTTTVTQVNSTKDSLNNEKTTKNSKKSSQAHQGVTEKVILKENAKNRHNKKDAKPTVLVNKVKHFQKQSKRLQDVDRQLDTPKKVKFELKNNSMQGAVDYYKSVRQSPSIPYDGTKKPSKTNLKPSTPSPINPFFKKKMKLTKK